MKGFANRRRLAILRFIRKNRQVSVGDIAKEINLSFKSTSKHIAVLVSADLLEHEQVGPKMYYYISKDVSEIFRRIISEL